MRTPRTTGTADPSPELRTHRRWQRVTALAAAGGLPVALSGCSDDPEQTAVEVAQANVSAKEQALADAESLRMLPRRHSARRARTTSRHWTATATS